MPQPTALLGTRWSHSLGIGAIGLVDESTGSGGGFSQWGKGRTHPRPFEPSIKSHIRNMLSTFGNKCPQNGSKNEQTAPRTNTGYPHIGPFVACACPVMEIHGSHLASSTHIDLMCVLMYRDTSLIRNRLLRGTCSRPMPRALRWS